MCSGREVGARESLSLQKWLPIGPGRLPLHLMYNLAIRFLPPSSICYLRVFIDFFTQGAAWRRVGKACHPIVREVKH